MKAGDIYLATFPFGDAPGMKLRPVLLLTGAMGPVPEVPVAYISSAVPSGLLASDVLLDPSTPHGASMKLKVLSVARLHKLATIHTTSLSRRLGAVPPDLMSQVRHRLRNMLAL